MAGLLTGAGDAVVYNSGTSTPSARTTALPSNAVAGDLLLLIHRTSRTGTSVGLSAQTPAGGSSWTKVADLRFGVNAANIDGAVWYRVLSAADITAGVVATNTGNAALRQVIEIYRTTGIDAAALAAAVPLTPVEAYNASVASTATVPAYTPATSPTLLLSILAVHANTTQPVLTGMAAGSRDTGGVVVSDAYNTGTGGSQAQTAMYVGWSDYTSTSQASAETLTFPGSGGNGGRALSASLALPAVAIRSGRAKYWDGTNWVSKPLKYFNGTGWVTKPAKGWDGSKYVLGK